MGGKNLVTATDSEADCPKSFSFPGYFFAKSLLWKLTSFSSMRKVHFYSFILTLDHHRERVFLPLNTQVVFKNYICCISLIHNTSGHLQLKVPNVKFDFEVPVRQCLLSTHTSKSNLTLGTHLHATMLTSFWFWC